MADITAIIGVCREDDPHDVDEAYGAGTYARLFPDEDDERISDAPAEPVK